VPYYLNITLASNNNNSATASTSQGSTVPSGQNTLYPIQDVEGAGVIDTNSTTQFVSDKNIVSTSRILPKDIDRLVYDSSSDNISQSIESFLAKPVLILSGNLDSTDTVSTFPLLHIPELPLSSSGVFVDKLSGFLGFRATTVVRIVVNATRFQQGRYILDYMPIGGADANSGNATRWIGDHMATLVQRTTLPHVEIDLCCDTEATMRIPYNSALNFYPLSSNPATSKYGEWGVLSLNPYVSIGAASGSLTCGFKIYCHFENVELIYAALPQSGRNTFSVKKKNATETEQNSAGIGPVSSALIKVRDASAIFAKVPLLSSYASTVSWFADLSASAAKVFGWTKPVVLAPSTRMTQNYLPYAANTDGPDMSFPISLSYENGVGVAAGFSGTDVDEMDFSFLCTIPVWNSTTNWSTGAASGTLLKSLLVSPTADTYTNVVNGTTFSHYTPMQFVANHFLYWRGSLVFKIKLVKTEFHSGRLLVCFSPFVAEVIVPSNPTIETSVYLHRQIIDVREANEFTFVVPYVSEAPWHVVFNGDRIGTFNVLVLEPLVAPATVKNSIDIIIEKSGGPDLQFATPQAFIGTYQTGMTPQSGDPFSSVAQETNTCSNLDTTIGTSLVKDDKGINSLLCIGESISSFRTLLKLPQLQIFATPPTPNSFLNVVPYAISSGTIITTINTAATVLNDLYSRVASCYVYSRGGVRIKFLDDASVTVATPVAVSLQMVNGSVTTRSSAVSWSTLNANGNNLNTSRNNSPVVYYRIGYSGEIQVPQYHRFHSRLNSDCVTNASTPYATTSTGTAPRIFISRQTIPLATVDCVVLRSMSDDGNMGGFLSIPPFFAQAV
jgi:hypothetical protein